MSALFNTDISNFTPEELSLRVKVLRSKLEVILHKLPNVTVDDQQEYDTQLPMLNKLLSEQFRRKHQQPDLSAVFNKTL